MDFIIILIFSLFQLITCETGQIRALILHVYRMGLFQTVISGLIYFQIQTMAVRLIYISVAKRYRCSCRHVTRRVLLTRQDLLTLPEHLKSLPVFSGVRVVRSF
jgi:hypothetical protein